MGSNYVLKEISSILGISPATISLIINRKGQQQKISKATIEKSNILSGI